MISVFLMSQFIIFYFILTFEKDLFLNEEIVLQEPLLKFRILFHLVP